MADNTTTLPLLCNLYNSSASRQIPTTKIADGIFQIELTLEQDTNFTFIASIDGSSISGQYALTGNQEIISSSHVRYDFASLDDGGRYYLIIPQGNWIITIDFNTNKLDLEAKTNINYIYTLTNGSSNINIDFTYDESNDIYYIENTTLTTPNFWIKSNKETGLYILKTPNYNELESNVEYQLKLYNSNENSFKLNGTYTRIEFKPGDNAYIKVQKETSEPTSSGSFKIGNTEIKKCYLGSTEIKRIYLGSTKIYEALETSAK